MILHRYTVSAVGHLADWREMETSRLPRSAVEDAGELLDSHGATFQARIPVKGFGHIELRWKSEDFSCAVATFAAEDDMLSTDVVLSGLRPEADGKAQQAGQAMIRDVCKSASEVATDGLLRADKRPAIACIRWSTRQRTGMDLVNDLEICLAAAFLERGFRASQLVF
ncbi:MAG: hypothetical protein ACE141_04445 [Bryobacteraceae bacterium]